MHTSKQHMKGTQNSKKFYLKMSTMYSKATLAFYFNDKVRDNIHYLVVRQNLCCSMSRDIKEKKAS